MAASVEIRIIYRDNSSGDRRKTADGLEGIGKSADKAKEQLNAFGQVTTGALRRVGEFAADALKEAGAAALAFVGDSINAAADYEQSMNVFQAQSSATAAEMDAVKQKAKDLGADLTLPATSAASAGAAMLELSKAGLTVAQSMDAAKGTLQLAAAAQIDEATAAAITAGALNTFGLEASQATRVADMLAAAANASSASITDLSQGVQQGGFAFAAAGQGIDDLTASVAILTNVGLTGSDAGTALKNAMMRLMNPTKEAAATMHSLGINVYDAQGKMRPMREIIDILDTAMAGMSDQQKNAALSTIFLSDGMKAMIPLLDGGVEGFDAMKEKINQQGAAANLAQAQMTGLHGAVGGLQSQVETLMLEGLEPLLPLMTAAVMSAAEFASGFSGQVGPAVSAVVGFVQTGLVPSLIGLGVATMVYAATQLPVMIAAVGASATAFMAQAAAIAATVAPLALIAAAVAGVAWAWNDYNTKLDTATTKLLESRDWWNQSTAALQAYDAAQLSTNANVAAAAGTVEQLRTQIEQSVETLGRRMAAGQVSDAQYAQEMATINQMSASLQTATGYLNSQVDAAARQAAATQTATARAGEMTAAELILAEQTQLTAEEMADLAKQMEDTFQLGATAVGNFVTTEAGFITQMEQAHAEGNATITADQAQAYAEQQAAQRAHLGSMLTNYTLTQVQMGNITAETGQQIVSEIEESFGVVEDRSASTFLAMAQSIDEAAASGGSAMSDLSSDLNATLDDAVDTELAMTDLSKQYTAELVQNFQDGKLDADSFRSALADIPRRVETEIHTKYTKSGDPPGGGGQPGAKALGGPVAQGMPYLVGERGPELMVPTHSGTIIPNNRLQLGGTTVINHNYYLTYTGVAQPAGDVGMALRTFDMLYGGR